MKLKYRLLALLTLAVTLLASCGITEELDAATQSISALQENLTLQDGYYQSLMELSDEMLTLLNTKQLESNKQALAYVNDEGTYYENHEKRTALLRSMSETNKKISQESASLLKIAKKKAVDVPNSDLKKIAQSLTIIDKNYAAVEIFLQTALDEEETLFTDLAADDAETIEEAVHSIRQIYGSLYLLLEESPANVEYSSSLTTNFLETYQKKK